MGKKTPKPVKEVKEQSVLKKVWNFIWNDDSLLSWVVNILLAFIIIKFIFYPAIGFAFQTDLPVVAVVSGSMEHNSAHPCGIGGFRVADGACLNPDTTRYEICGQNVPDFQRYSVDEYWELCGDWYEQNVGISLDEFSQFPFSNGFNIGDVMIIYGKDWDKIEIGDILLFMGQSGMPIIHRVVNITEEDGQRYLMTKGDHNEIPNPAGPNIELKISQEQYQGVAVAKIPWIGYVKIYFVRTILAIMGLFS